MRRYAAPFSLALLLAAGRTPAADAPQPLRVTAIPDADKDTLREDENRISAWLSAKIGVPVKFLPVENYAAAVTALVTGQADLGWLGGVTTVQALTQSSGKVRPLVMREGDLHFKSHVIVGGSLQASTLKDLKGKSFTFGSKSSTSGHVMPRYFLEKEGIVPETFFSRVAYSGDHTKTVLDVASGAVDAGAVNFKSFERLVAEKKVKPDQVRILWTTPEFVDYAWVIRDDVDARCGPGTQRKVAQAFVALDTSRPEDKKILAIQQTDHYIAAKTEWWQGISAVLEKIDVTR